MQEIAVGVQPIDRFLPVFGESRVRDAKELAEDFRRRLEGRVFWNVNSSGSGGGVDEMLRSVLAYVRGAGVDSRWLVIGGTPDFFRITKRLHNALHGSEGDGTPLGERERAIYE